MYSLEAGDNGDEFEIEFNNAVPIGPGSEILIDDIDLGETVTITAFDDGTPVSLADWTEQDITGEDNSYTDPGGVTYTDVTPGPAVWANWRVSSDGLTGTLTSPTQDQMDEPLNMLTPSQDVTELDFTEGGTGNVFYQVLSPGSTLSAVSGTGTYGGTATLSATLKSVAGTPMDDAPVTFELMEGEHAHADPDRRYQRERDRDPQRREPGGLHRPASSRAPSWPSSPGTRPTPRPPRTGT